MSILALNISLHKLNNDIIWNIHIMKTNDIVVIASLGEVETEITFGNYFINHPLSIYNYIRQYIADNYYGNMFDPSSNYDIGLAIKALTVKERFW